LSDTKALASLRKKAGSAPLFDSLPKLQTDEIEGSFYTEYKDNIFNASDLAFLQFTSGSTGMPKGVMVSQGNMVANITAIHQAFGTNQDSTVVGWLPFHHDMGLIGNLLAPIQVGMQCVLMPPLSFLQLPNRWLKAIDRYQACVSGGPNFAYDLCCKRISNEEANALDLSRWKVAFNGAEPVRASTMRQFAQKFSPAGFSSQAFFPCYGMAETTLIVSGEFNRREAQIVDAKALETQHAIINCALSDDDAREFVRCGSTYGDQQVEIVDAVTGEKLGENRVGEVWVSGSSVAQGYWNNPERTKETFQAFTQQGEGPFLRTGDRGFVKDGSLFITGRQKDMIIVRGRNYYPQDIEFSVENCHEALRKTGIAVFSVMVEEEEKVVVVAEVERLAIQTLQSNEVIMAIRQGVAHHHELELHAILLVKPMVLPKTSSGKIKRFACRQAYNEGSFTVLDSWHDTAAIGAAVSLAQEQTQTSDTKVIDLSEATIRAWLIDRFSQHLKVDRDTINLEDPIEKYGLSSLTAVQISGELTEWLHQDISPTIVYDYPTIALLATHLAGKETATDPDSNPSSDSLPSSDEPIAIVGMQCRFPGAPDIQSYWNLLSEGKGAIKEALLERWNKKEVSQIKNNPDALAFLTKGGFIDDVALFDAGFFGISPREATYMDPQQRIWLEVSWEALENAGIAPQTLEGKKAGVFVGVSSNDYVHLQNPLLGSVEQHAGTGNALSIIANRLSYALDLRGPSMCIDTACSSSLVAVHQACQSLRNGESDLAIAGGVNLILNPKISAIFGKSGMLAKDSTCKVLDAEADGYVRGEGCGAVILKRLSDAIKDGDTIQAVIKGSAINQDGKSNGLTAPNGLAQQAVIREALRKSKLSVAQIGYFEIHGTGTSLGDPIEVNSLVSLLKGNEATSFPRWIGSVKSNIGHLESAAGIAGLIKAVLCVKHAEIPPQINFKSLNPRINLAASQVNIPTTREKWETAEGHTRVAGVSAFGFGGTNAHMLVEEAPAKPALVPAPVLEERAGHLLALSARDPLALQQMAQRYLNYCQTTEVTLADLAYSANTGRSHFAHRLIVQASDVAQLQQQLQAYITGTNPVAGLQQGHKSGSHTPRIAFLFTGQGSQYPGMGHELYQSQSVFRLAMQACDDLLQGELEHSLLEVLYGEGEIKNFIHQTRYAQPAIFAIGYSLYQLWLSWGIRPHVVLGHSVGEYVAACVSGRIRLEEALPLIAKRGSLMQNLPAGGKMLAIQASATQVQPYLTSYQNRVSFAAINGLDQVVISGEGEAIDELKQQFQQAGLHSQALPVSHAFHSPLMRPIVAEFERICQQVTYGNGQIELISSQLGAVEQGEMERATYWVDQLEQPVLFSKALDCLQAQGCDICLELGAQPVLVGLGSRLSFGKGLWLHSLRRGQSDWSQLSGSVSSLYVAGVEIDWAGYEKGRVRKKISLPTYPFQRKKYWVEEADATLEGVDQGNAGLFNYLERSSLDTLIEQLAKEGKIEQEEVRHSQKVIQSLVEQYKQDQLLAGLQQDIYKVVWVSQPLAIASKSSAPLSWMLFSDETDCGRLIAQQWESEERGQVILVHTAEQYAQLSAQEYCLDPTQEIHFKQLIADLQANNTTTIAGIGYVAASNNSSLETISAQD
ncbi:MAG: beta-ketoacyl synthase N-terminal-like domain-containing protein, partial [Bacteroidota bacterium]